MTPYDTNDERGEPAPPAHQAMDPALARLLHTALSPLQADLDQLQRRLAASDGACAPAGMAKMAADLSIVVEQGRQTSSRLNEELGALGVQLRQQHMDVSDRVMSLQAGVGAQFDAVSAAIASASSQLSAHTSRVGDQLTQRQHELVADAVRKELAAQLAPMQERVRALTALLGVSVGLAVGSCSLLIISLLG